MLLLRPINTVKGAIPTARGVLALCVALSIAACSGAPTKSDRDSVAPEAATASAPASNTKEGSAVPSAAPDIVTANPSAPVDRRALADFERAVGLMRSGNSGEAELEFKTLAAGYPQLTGAQINLALLQRKANRLDEAEATLKTAAEKNPASAPVWNELGLTQRMRGQFPDAAASYQKALAIDPNFAAAHRNYGVLLDLYLGDPETALTELERYKELSGEDKPVSSWIAELRQRTGKVAPRKPAAPAPTEGAPTDGAPADGAPSSGTPADGAPANGAPTETPAAPAATPPAGQPAPAQPAPGRG
jgi:Flp pilus assembly protein TadD